MNDLKQFLRDQLANHERQQRGTPVYSPPNERLEAYIEAMRQETRARRHILWMFMVLVALNSILVIAQFVK